MCGRYAQKAKYKAVLKHFDLAETLNFENFSPQSEIFPTNNIVIYNNHHLLENVYWTIEDYDHKNLLRKVINARSETVHFVQMFREAFKKNRCLIPATSFFEWEELPDKTKLKYEFQTADDILCFAGISRFCKIKEEERRCAVILTTVANDVIRPIHIKNRMPVIIGKSDYETWLDPKTEFTKLKELMRPLPNDKISASPIKLI